MELAILLMAAVCTAAILLTCAVTAEILQNDVLPTAVVAGWICGVIFVPIVGSMLWLRTPDSAWLGLRPILDERRTLRNSQLLLDRELDELLGRADLDHDNERS